jgi:hypothetical protein
MASLLSHIAPGLCLDQRVATTANDHLSTSQQGPAASGMYVAVAVGPLGWHRGIGNSPYFAGLDALFWVDRLDGGGVVLQVVPRT